MNAYDDLRNWIDRYYCSSLPYVLICAPDDEHQVRRALAEQMIGTPERPVEHTREVRVVASPICEAGRMLLLDKYVFQYPFQFTRPAARTPGSPSEPEPYLPLV